MLQPTGEPSTSLANTIRRCKTWPALRKLGEAAVVFLLCRVGESFEAESFLKTLERDENLKDIVYVSPHRVDNQLAIFQRCGDNDGYRAWVSLGQAIDS
jgi:hypothetical protein